MSKRPLGEKLGQVSNQEIVDITLAIDETAVVSITDFTGKIQYVNDKFCEISKYSREELQEVDHRLINSEYHPPEFFKQMWGTIRSGKVWKGEIRNRAKDGKIYWMDTTIVPILQTQGKPYKYVSICQDITEHKQAKEEHISLSSNARLHLPSEDKHTSRSRSNPYKELLQSEANMSRSHLSGSDNSFRETQRFFRFSPEMLCIVGFDGYFKTVNPAFKKILSYAPEELLAKSFLDFVHPEDKALTLAQLQKLSTEASTIQFENRYRCQDGSYRWLAWSASSVIEDGVMYAIARDITESKRLKATLLERSRDSTLEADVGEALSQSGTLPESLKRCTEAIVKHLDAIGVGIWTVDPSTATETTDLLFLNLQASAGHLIPTDTFPSQLPQTIASLVKFSKLGNLSALHCLQQANTSVLARERSFPILHS
jgi:PAS domain S-box-containing protein